MLRTYFRHHIKKLERRFGGSLEFLRHVLRESLPAFLKFRKLGPLAEYRQALPPAAYHLARIVAARDEDCGSCVQIEVNLARQAGVAPDLIQAVLDQRFDSLPEDLANVCRFAEAVVIHSGAENELRQKLRRTYGEAAFVELALAVAVCRVFPIVQRALGYAVNCADVHVDVNAAG